MARTKKNIRKRRKRLIELDEEVWVALGIDADRCRRSDQKQLEAILLVRYGLADVDVDPRPDGEAPRKEVAARIGGRPGDDADRTARAKRGRTGKEQR
jgi:hypothetical protein